MFLIGTNLLQSFQLSLGFAWRNVWRNKRRSSITILAVAFATLALIFFISLQLSAYATSIGVSTSVLHGHAQVLRTGYHLRPDFDLAFVSKQDSGASIKEELQSISGIQSLTERASSFAMASSEERSYGVEIMGIVPEGEKEISTIPGVITEGRYLNSGAEAIVGGTLAKNLKIGINDEITILAQGKEGGLVAEVITVVGVFKSGLREVDGSLIQIPLDFFQEAFQLENEIHSIVILLEKIDGLDTLLPVLRDKLPQWSNDLKVYPWDELLPGLKQAIQLDMAIGSIFYLCLLLVIATIIGNTFLMAVLERRKEFGVMHALGMTRRSLCGMVLGEAFFLTTLGLLLGTVLACFVVYYFSIYGFFIPGSEEVAVRLNIQSVVYPWITIKSLTIGPLAVLFISFLSVIYPALQPLRVDPVEATRT